MTQRRPIVLHDGRLTELPVGDTVVGVAESLAALPLATWAIPDEFLVQQAGQWVRATYAQMQAWFPGGGGSLPTGAVTVDGAPVLVNGQNVTVI